MSKIDFTTLDQLNPLIQDAICAIPESKRYFIALSGGLDSMALLQFIVPYLSLQSDVKIQVIHIHHGLSSYADEWAAHCSAVCAEMNIVCNIERVSVVTDGQGIEAAARKARYRVFDHYLSDGGVLLQGHHQNDQAETVLMRLLRGAGPEGLSGIPQQRAIAKGVLFRPWLKLPRSVLESEMKHSPIKWVEDESNSDLQFDRNFIRHKILPLLSARWPNTLNSLSRTAVRSDQAHQQILSWCEAHQQSLYSELYPQAIQLESLARYSNQQQRLLVRFWLEKMQVEHPSEKVFERLWTELIPAEHDAMPALRWGNNHLRRFNACLFYLRAEEVEAQAYDYQIPCMVGMSSCSYKIAGRDFNIILGEHNGVVADKTLVIRAPEKDEAVSIRSRKGGEGIALAHSNQNKALKKLLQEKKVPTWRRAHLPIVYYGDVLALVVLGSGDGLLADGFQVKSGESAIFITW